MTDVLRTPSTRTKKYPLHMTLTARITAFTHRGLVRAGNQDTIVVGDWVSRPAMEAPREIRHVLTQPIVCAVADGMGGHAAGEVASRHVAQRLAERAGDFSDTRATAAALEEIDGELYQAMARDENLLGMGTTVVGFVLAPRAIWFNVGDSRLYRYDSDRLAQVSVDDSPPGPRRGLLTQSMGGALGPFAIEPHVGETELSAPTRFLLCSDGLTDMLDDDEIAACLARPDGDALAQLFERAMRAGGVDNISIVLMSVDAG